MRILCVCRGNTCRSPMVESVLRARLPDAVLDSAGTNVRNAGGPPDPRGQKSALARGYDTSELRSRQVRTSDFTDFDLILAMDAANLSDLRNACPADATSTIRLFDPQGRDIPDPYHGGQADYEHALDMIEHAADALLANIQKSENQ